MTRIALSVVTVAIAPTAGVWRSARAAEGSLVDLANAKCPVRGGSVAGKSFTEWIGFRVGHCCPGCSAKFLTAAENSLDGARIPRRAAADAVRAVEKASGADREKALDALRKRWRVLRESAAAGSR